MSIVRPQRLIALLMTLAAATLTGCSGVEPRHAKAQEPFSFDEVRQLALPITTTSLAARASVAEQSRQRGLRISSLYGEALNRFEGVYGDGVGPARGASDYLRCKAEFHKVAEWVAALPMQVSRDVLGSARTSLEQCRQLGDRWSSPAEMATFGQDFRDMTDGSMLVLSYTARASGIAGGVRSSARIELAEQAKMRPGRPVRFDP